MVKKGSYFHKKISGCQGGWRSDRPRCPVTATPGWCFGVLPRYRSTWRSRGGVVAEENS